MKGMSGQANTQRGCLTSRATLSENTPRETPDAHERPICLTCLAVSRGNGITHFAHLFSCSSPSVDWQANEGRKQREGKERPEENNKDKTDRRTALPSHDNNMRITGKTVGQNLIAMANGRQSRDTRRDVSATLGKQIACTPACLSVCLYLRSSISLLRPGGNVFAVSRMYVCVSVVLVSFLSVNGNERLVNP